MVFFTTATTILSLLLTLLPFRSLAQQPQASPGTTNTYNIYDTHSLTVHWARKPIDGYSLYANTAYDFQLWVNRLADIPYSPTSTPWTDWCTVPEGQQPPKCIHMHIVPFADGSGLGPGEGKGDMDRELLGKVVGAIRGLGFAKIWTLEATFAFGPRGGKPVGMGYVTQRESDGSETVFSSGGARMWGR